MSSNNLPVLSSKDIPNISKNDDDTNDNGVLVSPITATTAQQETDVSLQSPLPLPIHLPPVKYGYRTTRYEWSELQHIILVEQNLDKLCRSVDQQTECRPTNGIRSFQATTDPNMEVSPGLRTVHEIGCTTMCTCRNWIGIRAIVIASIIITDRNGYHHHIVTIAISQDDCLAQRLSLLHCRKYPSLRLVEVARNLQ
jgi:hypothetical protein